MAVVPLGERLVIVRDAEAIERHRQDEARRRRNAKARPHRAKSRAKRLQRIPPWADPIAIAKFYAKAEWMSRRYGRIYEVDHIIPLLGETVSGLHVETNLRVVSREVNRRKSNQFVEELVGGAGFEPATPSV